MNQAIQTVDRLLRELRALQPLKSADQQRLDKKFRLEFNYNSNHLEGNTLTYGETQLLLLFDDTQGNHQMREYEEMKAHDVAWQLVNDWANDPERPLSEQHIKKLNEIILVRPFYKDAVTPDGQATRRLIKVGDYKEHPNSVRQQNGELFHYTAPMDTPIEMGELIRWYREETMHPVALAALLHYKFVRIHPFDDGNGRVSRLLMNYVLLLHGFPPVVIRSKEKKEYLRALHLADTGNIDAFIGYIAEQVVISLELSIRAANGEPIEDSDDLDKEIALWKQDLTLTQPEVLPYSKELAEARYQDSIRPLITDFIETHQTHFAELFFETEMSISSKSTAYHFDGRNPHQNVEEVLDKIGQTFATPSSDIFVMINFGRFKRNGTLSFDERIELQILLRDFEWTIDFRDITKHSFYTNALNSDEATQFVKQTVRITMDSIKAKIKVPF